MVGDGETDREVERWRLGERSRERELFLVVDLFLFLFFSELFFVVDFPCYVSTHTEVLLCKVDTISINRLHKHTPNTHYDHTAICRGKTAHVCLCLDFVSLTLFLFLRLRLSPRAVLWESCHARFRSSPQLSFSRSAAVRGSRTKCYHAQACITPWAYADLGVVIGQYTYTHAYACVYLSSTYIIGEWVGQHVNSHL